MALQTYIFNVPAPYGQLNLNDQNVVIVQATDDAHADALLNSKLAVQYNQLHGFDR